jgi:Tfp pilus assembly protein FimT
MSSTKAADASRALQALFAVARHRDTEAVRLEVHPQQVRVDEGRRWFPSDALSRTGFPA